MERPSPPYGRSPSDPPRRGVIAAAGQRDRWARRRQGHHGKGDPPRAHPRKPAITCDRPGWSPGHPPGRHREAAGSTWYSGRAAPSAGAPWTAVDRDGVDRIGRYALSWTPRSGLRLLRVVLKPYKSFAGSAAAAPAPKISACKVTRGVVDDHLAEPPDLTAAVTV